MGALIRLITVPIYFAHSFSMALGHWTSASFITVRMIHVIMEMLTSDYLAVQNKYLITNLVSIIIVLYILNMLEENKLKFVCS